MNMLTHTVMLLASIWQDLTTGSPPAMVWSIVIILGLVMAEIIKQLINPLFRKAQRRHADTLLERITELLESNAIMIQRLVVQSNANHEWHQAKRPDGSPMAYFDEARIMEHFSTIEGGLSRIERKIK